MMMDEFTERTGFEPTFEEYLQIEQAYYNFDGNKNVFCREFVEKKAALWFYRSRAKKIEQLQCQLLEREQAHQLAIAQYEYQIKQLQTALDSELDWMPCNGGTNLGQGRYERLYNAPDTKALTEQQAKDFIARECGFDPSRVSICTQAATYEVNKHRQMRVANQFERPPVYNATDWNYVRFNCAGTMYELINGELNFYTC